MCIPVHLAEVLCVCGYMNKSFESAHAVIILYERGGNQEEKEKKSIFKTASQKMGIAKVEKDCQKCPLLWHLTHLIHIWL